MGINATPSRSRVRNQVSQLMTHGTANFSLRNLPQAGRCRIDPHGPEWRQACIDLGIPDEPRCHDLPLPRRRQKPKYSYQCPNCLEVLMRIRPLKRYSACFTCCSHYNRGRHSARFAYECIPLQLGVQLAREAEPESL